MEVVVFVFSMIFKSEF